MVSYYNADIHFPFFFLFAYNNKYFSWAHSHIYDKNPGRHISFRSFFFFSFFFLSSHSSFFMCSLFLPPPFFQLLWGFLVLLSNLMLAMEANANTNFKKIPNYYYYTLKYTQWLIFCFFCSQSPSLAHSLFFTQCFSFFSCSFLFTFWVYLQLSSKILDCLILSVNLHIQKMKS